MTAIGLAVAVPAVLGYNWLVRRNKVTMEAVRSFSADLHVRISPLVDVYVNCRPNRHSIECWTDRRKKCRSKERHSCVRAGLRTMRPGPVQ